MSDASLNLPSRKALPDYVADPFAYQRFVSRTVMVGDVPVGGGHEIVLQSMTTADTKDTEAVVAEAIAMYKAGSRIVRITAPGPRDAENLKNIKQRLREEGYDFPLVADIHFAPKAALIAIEHVEKVRINPGNFVDSKKFKVLEYDDESYLSELDRLREVFTPLVLRAKELGRALRIGANHGSLSDRILNRYGDTPLGMVESAMEYLRVAVSLDYFDIILSMKASNPQVMIQAYRLLIQKFCEEGMDFPLHLGVTEAGFGWDGRLKSAVGIGSLLLDGIGDTIRVSLTEDPVEELPPARRIASLVKTPHTASQNKDLRNLREAYFRAVRPASYARLKTAQAKLGGLVLGNKAPVKILLPLVASPDSDRLGADWLSKIPSWLEGGADALFVTNEARRQADGQGKEATPPGIFVSELKKIQTIPVLEMQVALPARMSSELASVLEARPKSLASGLWVHLDCNDIFNKKNDRVSAWEPRLLLPVLREALHLLQDKEAVLSLSVPAGHTVSAYRLLVALAQAESLALPALVLYADPKDEDDLLYRCSAELGGLFLDGIGDALAFAPEGPLPVDQLLSYARDLLQATRLRLSKTEFISCPSCGRTLFDLQSTTSRIEERTGHLKGVKIAVMGCIVNGPGEMADADFGYVGAGPGKIHLYKEKEIVKNNIPEERAVDELIGLIREHGMWKDP